MKTITEEQEIFLNKYTNGNWKLNTESGLVDVDGDFSCSDIGLSDFLGIEFGDIRENFSCSRNELVSLKGAPQKVGKSFYCYNNQLVSLEGAPQEVGGNFNCSHNQLVSLEGAPQEVGGNFNCSYNRLVSLEGAPKKVGYSFYCSHNKLVSLEGAPQKVGWDFDCYHNKLVSLEGAPKNIMSYLFCDPINLRGCDINKLSHIFFSINGENFYLETIIGEITNRLKSDIYLKKMI